MMFFYIRDCEWCGITKMWRHRFQLFCFVCSNIPALVADGIDTPAAGSMTGRSEIVEIRKAKAELDTP